jgi:hypothetical protein
MFDASRQVYIVKNGRFDFACLKCAFTKSVNVDRFLQSNKELLLKIKCKCGNLQSIKLDRRKDQRKPTNIQGKYFLVKKDRLISDGDISIRDMSCGGVGFELLNASNGTFATGDVLRVNFKLFQNSSPLIQKESIVKNIKDLFISATFKDPLKIENNFLLKLFFYT